MKYLLIPVKDLTRAKQRLASLMSQPERTTLARLMMENTFAQVAAARGADGVAIVTNYPPATALAEFHGFEVITETEQISESASVDYGSQILLSRGATAVLRLPLDLPLLESTDIELLLSHIRPEPSAVIVPSREGTGTNAIARTPPDLFPSHFGPGSLAKHRAEADRLGIPCELLTLPRIAVDIDDPADLTYLLARNGPGPIIEYLHELDIPARLNLIA
ncbi:MAG: 2-phospho-L-lactate guanylyltransferase [Blastocatellia bacterium]